MKNLVKLMQAQFDKMCAYGILFRSSLSGESLWALYMKGFGADPVFRDPNSSVHNCNLCNNFIRRYGNIVALDANLDVVTMFDIDGGPEYGESLKLMSEALKRARIANIFVESYAELNSLPYEACKKTNDVFKLGIDKNHKMYNKAEAEKYGVVKEGEVRTFHHFCLYLPKVYVSMNESSATVMSTRRANKEVLKRGLDEINMDTLELVRDLIQQGSLLNGDAYLNKVKAFIHLKKTYTLIPQDKKDSWCWSNVNTIYSGFRNELIGTLCVELSEGEELNKACESWNKRVDPVNYMKVKSPITQRQIEEAKKFVDENGYSESFNRRMATIDDVIVSEILHYNAGDGEIKKVSVFDNVKVPSTRHKRSEFNNVEEIHIDKFMRDVLPTCTSVELFFENRMEEQMVTLMTSDKQNDNIKNILKWGNNYSWTYKGNITGKSQIKEAVKSRGGITDAVLRFSIMWSEKDVDNSDLDAWAKEPDGRRIGFSTEYRKDRSHSSRTPMSGQLDVDIMRPSDYKYENIVENIAWNDISKMKDGEYKLWVNMYSNRGSKGFKAEVEVNDEIYTYEYTSAFGEDKTVAVVIKKGNSFTIEHKMKETATSREIYGLSTGEFHQVNLVCLSPNYWQDNSVGFKHYFFMLKGCKSPVALRTFHNEHLNSELLQHRKVMDVLGNSSFAEPIDRQLSGVGFNSTVRDSVILRLKGSHKRVVNVKL